MQNLICLIPAKGESKRVPGKNMRSLGGRPLLEWTIRNALESGIFEKIFVSSEDSNIIEWVRRFSVDHVKDYKLQAVVRSKEFSRPNSPDIQWIQETLCFVDFYCPEYFILRCTSPFLKPETIKNAWRTFADSGHTSLRAVRKVTEHPNKMWAKNITGQGMHPAYGHFLLDGCPSHSVPTQLLPELYVQTAGMEICNTASSMLEGRLVGPNPMFFELYDSEALDINTEFDWMVAEALSEKIVNPV